ncbi:hypothetical protein COBT_001401 [Conglomerata obtusa]
MTEKVIITHDGTFHLDELLAISILQQIYPATKIVRTRDHSTLSQYDILAVVDVFGVFDPNKNLFDHHQRGFNETFTPETGVKLSSAGLVYRHFALQFLNTYEIPYSQALNIYKKYFIHADAIDNGIDVQSKVHIKDEYRPIKVRSFSDIVSLYNDNDDFETALEFVKGDLDRFMKRYKKNTDNIESVRMNMLECEGDILILTVKDNVMDIVCELEKQMNRNYKYLIMNDTRWKGYAVIKEVGSFENKVPFYEKWRGLRNEELQKVCGVKDAIFVHASGFLAICNSFDGILELCKKSLEIYNNQK